MVQYILVAKILNMKLKGNGSGSGKSMCLRKSIRQKQKRGALITLKVPKRHPRSTVHKKVLSQIVDAKTQIQNSCEEYLSEFLHSDELTNEEKAQCVPNGKLSIQCFICGQKLSKIFELREHISWHENIESYNESTLEAAPIYETLNPKKHNIETTTIRDFLIGEIKAKRHSQFYGILTAADVELHISDSETEDEDVSDSDNTKETHAELNTETKHCSDKQMKTPSRISNTYKCDLCNLAFNRRYKALFHQKTSHSQSRLRFQCDYCCERFIGLQLLIHHLKTQCESDEYPITCVERFRQHLLKVNIEQFQCLAEARNELKSRRISTAEKLYSCNVCEKTFLRSEHLTRHRAVHLPEELKMECLVCFKKFNRKDNLRNHMKVHMSEAERDLNTNQAILCQVCGHYFASKSNYVVHMRRHTGEKPFTCDVCGKGFPKSTDLNLHKITHTGERNFICNICNKAFARSAVLSKHMRVHEGPYNCNYCNESFKRPNELANHLRNHAACLTHKCQICRSEFNKKEELETHHNVTGHSSNTQIEATPADASITKENFAHDVLLPTNLSSVYLAPINSPTTTNMYPEQKSIAVHDEQQEENANVLNIW